MNTLTLPEAESKVDRMEAICAKLPQVDMPLVHRFTPGLYVREIRMPAGSLVISKRHKTEHPFVVSMGKVDVWTAGKGVERLSAPFTGITKPNTRRVIHVLEDTIWTTFHPTTETDIEKIEAQVIEPHAVGESELDEATIRQIVEAHGH